MEESNVQPVRAPVTVVGDINGKFHDMLNIFELIGEVPDKRFLFLGGYVDKNYNSLETVQLLLCLKVKYPDSITLLRGNHDCGFISSYQGKFYMETLRKYGNIQAFTYCCEVFDYLPLTAIIEGRIFCVHGGLSPDLAYLDHINTIDRFQRIPTEGPMTDLIWSDPADELKND